ncbi:MAG: hypothetical protein ACLR8Y_18140 [Alistipes indistinctus]
MISMKMGGLSLPEIVGPLPRSCDETVDARSHPAVDGTGRCRLSGRTGGDLARHRPE